MTKLPPCPVDPPAPPIDGRDALGRFAPGNPGGGRPAGVRNHATIVLETLFEGEAESVGRVAIDAAKKGDIGALRLVLERLLPPRRSRPIHIPNMPKVETAADVPAALAFLTAAVADGTIDAEAATALAGLLEKFSSAFDAAILSERIDELEKRLVGGANGGRNAFSFALDRPDQDE